ncbi:MAG: OsmC family protein [Pseudorhodoplanes sp.]|nr:OsmC family protein [Pseudorhodoplanes sp.]
MTRSTMINGVDRQKLFGTIEAIKATPSLAGFQFRVFNQWVEGGENRSRIDDYYGAGEEMRHATPFFLVNDEPPVLLSGDKAPNPVEYVLHALAGCLTTSLVYHAAAHGIAVKSLTTRFEGDLDLRGFLGLSNDVRRGFSNIRAVFDLDADCDEAKKQELVAMAQAHSPVFDIVSNGLPVSCMLGASARRPAAA